MKAKYINNKIDIKPVLDKIHSIKKKNEDGRYSYPAFEFEEIKWTLLTNVDFGFDISEHNKLVLIDKAIKEVSVKEIKDKTAFLKSFNEIITNHYKKKDKEYWLLCSLSVNSLPIKKITVNDCEIRITGRKFPTKFRKHRANLYNRKYGANETDDYLKVLVKCTGRDVYDTFGEMEKALDIFRAFISLKINSSNEIELGDRQQKPINKMIFGNFFTVHTSSGATFNQKEYWFNHNKKVKIYHLKDREVESIKKSLRPTINRLNKCSVKHKQHLSQSLISYVTAFDEVDMYSCFLKSWTSLEKILSTDSNDLLIKRCSSMFYEDERAYIKLVLEGLRQYRNKLVHGGTLNLLYPKALCYQNQDFFYYLVFNFHLSFAGKIDSTEELNLFLDKKLTNFKELKKQKKILDKVIKFKDKFNES